SPRRCAAELDRAYRRSSRHLLVDLRAQVLSPSLGGSDRPDNSPPERVMLPAVREVATGATSRMCQFSPRTHRSGHDPAARKRWSCPIGSTQIGNQGCWRLTTPSWRWSSPVDRLNLACCQPDLCSWRDQSI